MAGYGIVEAARRARSWCPLLETEGQRLVLLTLVAFMRSDSVADPTSGQLRDVCGYHPSSIRRILGQLEELGAISPTGHRPVYDRDGVGRGGKVTLWMIPPAPSGATVAPAPLAATVVNSHPRPGARPPAPSSTPTRASEGAPLRTEKLREEESTSSIEECDHDFGSGLPGFCSKCGASKRRIEGLVARVAASFGEEAS